MPSPAAETSPNTALDAEALCRQLAEQIRPDLSPATLLVGIGTGGL